MGRLLTLISQAESPVRGYDAVYHNATVTPPKAPNQMTIAEIFAWVRRDPKIVEVLQNRLRYFYTMFLPQ